MAELRKNRSEQAADIRNRARGAALTAIGESAEAVREELPPI